MEGELVLHNCQEINQKHFISHTNSNLYHILLAEIEIFNLCSYKFTETEIINLCWQKQRFAETSTSPMMRYLPGFEQELRGGFEQRSGSNGVRTERPTAIREQSGAMGFEQKGEQRSRSNAGGEHSSDV